MCLVSIHLGHSPVLPTAICVWAKWNVGARNASFSKADAFVVNSCVNVVVWAG